MRSIVDADLALRGNVTAPTLGGVGHREERHLEPAHRHAGQHLRSRARRSRPSAAVAAGAGRRGGAAAVRRPVLVPSTLRVENNLARLVASADLPLRGTYDRPLLFGRADVERGEVTFEGRRYRITRGSIDFTNPTRIEPFFDVEAETRVRVPGQTYRVTVGVRRHDRQLQPTLSSDPPLPTADVLALLFSDVRRGAAEGVAPELRALQNPNQAQTDILTARATQVLTAPISAEVGKVVEQTFGVDTFQLTPSFVDPDSIQPTARLNPVGAADDRQADLGSRLPDVLAQPQHRRSTIRSCCSRSTSSDRLSWILSRNEDSQTYALEFRVRHVF